MEDLTKKLEEISLPEIEIPSHKRELRETLLSKYPKEKRIWAVFDILQKTIPLGMAIILIFFAINNLIYPNYNLSKAKEIALKNPQVKELIEKGGEIKDIEIIKNQAYLLVQPIREEEKMAIPELEKMGAAEVREAEKEEISGALIQINLKGKEINKIKKLSPQAIPLTEKEEELAKEIAEKNPQVQEVIKKEAKVKEINPPPSYQMKLLKEDDSIKVVPEEKKVQIIYEFDNNLLKGEVDLIEGRVKNVQLQEKAKE